MESVAVESLASKISNFTCSKCSNYYTPPIRQCRHGHVHCSTCVATGISCTLCLAALDVEVPILSTILDEFRFPCSYIVNGCESKVNWRQLQRHREVCDYRSYVCPVGCEKNVDSFEVQTHFRDVHGTSIEDLTFHNPYRKLDQQPFHQLVSKFNTIFYVAIESEDEKVTFSVKYFGVLKKNFYNYTVKILCESEDDFKITNTKPCLLACRSEHEPIQLDLNLCRKLNQNNVVKYQIDIAKNEGGSLDCMLVDKLTCPICCNFMSTMINLCENGHSFCSKCRCHISVCPMCRGAISSSRNFQLEAVCLLFSRVAMSVNVSEDH